MADPFSVYCYIHSQSTCKMWYCREKNELRSSFIITTLELYSPDFTFIILLCDLSWLIRQTSIHQVNILYGTASKIWRTSPLGFRALKRLDTSCFSLSNLYLCPDLVVIIFINLCQQVIIFMNFGLCPNLMN